jgi:cyclopropane fatty-acyl-phospholipid synthase-like methyltransferase
MSIRKENMHTQPYSSAAERNRQPILDQLRVVLPQQGEVLEIGSGTGQHAAFFTRSLPGLTWQPSDREENLAGLEACFSAEANERILPLLKLDVIHDPWPGCSYDAVYSANTAHIMPWEAVIAMFTGVGAHLATGGKFCLYGPFNIDKQFTSQSNARFDSHLRAQDSQMGIRDMGAIEALANLHHMQLEQKIAMPANNFILVFGKS